MIQRLQASQRRRLIGVGQREDDSSFGETGQHVSFSKLDNKKKRFKMNYEHTNSDLGFFTHLF